MIINVLTGLIWVSQISGWVYIEDGDLVALYNHPMDFCNRISIASPHFNPNLWEKVIQSVKDF